MNSKHTPGPWEIRETEIMAGDNCLGTLYHSPGMNGSLPANARLIAETPNLLATLLVIIEMAHSATCRESRKSIMPKIGLIAHSAVKKATS